LKFFYLRHDNGTSFINYLTKTVRLYLRVSRTERSR